MLHAERAPLTAAMLAVAVLTAAAPAHPQSFGDDEPVACLGVNVIPLEDVVFGNAVGNWEYEGVKNGLPVVNVVRGSPAALSGVRTGDFIDALDGNPVYLPGELVTKVQDREVGTRFELELYRRGETVRINGVLGQRVGDLCQPAPPGMRAPPR